MTGSYSTALLVAALLAFLANAEGFFIYSSNKKTSTDRVMPPQPHHHHREQPSFHSVMPSPWLPPQPQYLMDSSGAMTSVALPVAVPVQSQMGSMPSSLKGMVHNVQLVPCLCPVSRDAEVSFTQNQQGSSQQSYGFSSTASQPSSDAFTGSQQMSTVP